MSMQEAEEEEMRLDNILLELTEALTWLRRRRNVSASDVSLENRIARRKAIDVIRHLHWELHQVESGSRYYPHQSLTQCRKKLIERCEEVRFLEMRELYKLSMKTHLMVHHIHGRYIEFD